MTPLYSNEILLNNVVDKYIQRLLMPLNFVQSLFLLSKYKIRDNFVTPNSLADCIKAFFAVVFYDTMEALLILLTNFNTETVSLRLNNVFYFVYYIFAFGFCFANYLQCRDTSVEFVIKLQKIYKALNVGRHDGNMLKCILRGNWFSISMTVVIYGVVILYHVATNFYSALNMFFIFTMLYFDSDVIYACQMIKLLRVYLQNWLKLNRYVGNGVKIDEIYDIPSEGSEETGDRYGVKIEWRESFRIYTDIVEMHDFCVKMFRPTMFLYTCFLFFTTMVYVETVIGNTKNFKITEVLQNFSTVIIVVWITKNYVLQILLSVEFEKFYMAVENVTFICTLRASETSSDAERRMCKNVHRLNRTALGKVSACGAFDVDAALSLRFLSTVATYTIVLLQFALL